MKLKILFLSANPHQDLSPDEEYRIIENVISKSSIRDNIQLVPKFAVRINDIISAINEVEPHIVHFTGHGTKDGELRLTDSSGDMDELLSTESLEKLFLTTKSVKLVFLSACHSISQTKAISSHIDYVIGMKRQINDITAIAFAETFYGSIFTDKSIDNALNQAIVRLETEYKGEVDIPELFEKSFNKFNFFNIISTNKKKLQEIEDIIILNDLIMATKMIVQFVTDYSKNKSFRREALLHQSSVKALNDDIRKFGKTSDTEREMRLLKNSLFEFLEILGEKCG